MAEQASSFDSKEIEKYWSQKILEGQPIDTPTLFQLCYDIFRLRGKKQLLKEGLPQEEKLWGLTETILLKFEVLPDAFHSELTCITHITDRTTETVEIYKAYRSGKRSDPSYYILFDVHNYLSTLTKRRLNLPLVAYEPPFTPQDLQYIARKVWWAYKYSPICLQDTFWDDFNTA